MIHTYREPDSLESGVTRFVRGALFPLLVVAVLLTAAASSVGSFTRDDAEGLGSLLVFFLIVSVCGLLHDRHRRCSEIRLGDDGTCELETKRRLIRLHVAEIRSVEYHRDDESDSESYTIHYQSGKVRVSERMTDFSDFLARLKTLNPVVELTGFPADAWSGFDIAPTGFRIRGVVFPLIIVGFLIVMAIATVGRPRLPSAGFLFSLLPFVGLFILWISLVGYLQRRRARD